MLQSYGNFMLIQMFFVFFYESTCDKCRISATQNLYPLKSVV